MARDKLETALVNRMISDLGWTDPTMKIQRVMFPGVTPAKPSQNGRGRGPVVLDLEYRDDTAGIQTAYVAGLKTSAKTIDSVTVTTGKPEHTDAVISGAMAGRDIPLICVQFNGAAVSGSWDTLWNLDGFDSVKVAVLNIGQMIRDCNGEIPAAAVGQGKGRGKSHPISQREKRQKAKSGKVYHYIELTANTIAADVTWHTLSSFADLAEFIREHSEGVFL